MWVVRSTNDLFTTCAFPTVLKPLCFDYVPSADDRRTFLSHCLHLSQMSLLFENHLLLYTQILGKKSPYVNLFSFEGGKYFLLVISPCLSMLNLFPQKNITEFKLG